MLGFYAWTHPLGPQVTTRSVVDIVFSTRSVSRPRLGRGARRNLSATSEEVRKMSEIPNSATDLLVVNHRSRWRRTKALFAGAVAVWAMAACQPTPVLPAPPLGTVPAPVGASLSVGTDATGCDEDFQNVEVRLVAGSGTARFGLATTTTSGGDTAEVAVPEWAPSGPAEVEASCLEPDFSMASDGADVVRFDYQPVAVTVGGSWAPLPTPTLTVPAVVSDGTLEVAGSGCSGRVLVGVAQGRVPSAGRFHYGRRLVTAAPDGTWSTSIDLTYRAGEFADPVVPGAFNVFAVCEGWLYSPAGFEVTTGSAPPAVHVVGPFPGLVGLTQCPPYNTVSILAVVELPSGATVGIGHHEPGRGFGEQIYTVAIPADAMAVSWHASCSGVTPSFVYAPAHVAR